MKLSPSLILPLTFFTTGAVLLSTQTLANQPIATPQQVAQTSRYQPLPNQYCRILHDDAAKALATSFTLKKGPFTNYITKEKGTGCTMEAKGNGVKFKSPANVVNKLKAAFIGWDENTSYQADGPTGKAVGLTRDQALLLINVEWQPIASAKCPKNVPIGDCNLKPNQQIYSIKLQVAMK